MLRALVLVCVLSALAACGNKKSGGLGALNTQQKADINTTLEDLGGMQAAVADFDRESSFPASKKPGFRTLKNEIEQGCQTQTERYPSKTGVRSLELIGAMCPLAMKYKQDIASSPREEIRDVKWETSLRAEGMREVTSLDAFVVEAQQQSKLDTHNRGTVKWTLRGQLTSSRLGKVTLDIQSSRINPADDTGVRVDETYRFRFPSFEAEIRASLSVTDGRPSSKITMNGETMSSEDFDRMRGLLPRFGFNDGIR